MCSNFKDGKYCYVKCLDKHFPPPDQTKMTKITCKCDKQAGSCDWIAAKPFTGCMGPCEEPVRQFTNLDSYFKIKKDYSEEIATFQSPTDSLHAVFRVQSKTSITGWTLAVAFTEPQFFDISTADVDLQWNCKRNILLFQPKMFNFGLNGKKSHSFLALIEGARQADLKGKFSMFLYEGLIGSEDANCLDPDFGPDYCEEDEPVTIEPTVEPTIELGTTSPATWPTMSWQETTSLGPNSWGK